MEKHSRWGWRFNFDDEIALTNTCVFFPNLLCTSYCVFTSLLKLLCITFEFMSCSFSKTNVFLNVLAFFLQEIPFRYHQFISFLSNPWPKYLVGTVIHNDICLNSGNFASSENTSLDILLYIIKCVHVLWSFMCVYNWMQQMHHSSTQNSKWF